MLGFFGQQQSDSSWSLWKSRNNDDDDNDDEGEADHEWGNVNNSLHSNPLRPCTVAPGFCSDLFFERSRDRLALSKRNQSVRGDPPQHWGQEQAEGGDAEDQQVDLEGKAHELAVISVTWSLILNKSMCLQV